MEIIFLLFFIFIVYSHSIDIQEIELADSSFRNLRASTFPDFFYISINVQTLYNNIHFLLLDNGYNISNINFCFTSSSPSDWTISSCKFYSYKYINSKTKSEGILYHYNVPILSSNSYIIIKYSGNNPNGEFKARSYFMEKVPIDSHEELELSAAVNITNEFYTEIGNPSSNYLYFNFTDLNNNLQQPIFHCLTYDNPKYYSPLSFIFLNYDKKNKIGSKYEYYYSVDIKSYKGYYIVIHYSVNSSHSSIYVQSSYNSFSSKLSTVAIVFIVITPVIIGIIITILCLIKRKRRTKNIAPEPAPIQHNEEFPAAPIYPTGDEIYKTTNY